MNISNTITAIIVLASAIMLVMASDKATAAPTNAHIIPTCIGDVGELPINIIYVSHVVDGVVSRSRGTVFLVAPSYWITAAHVVKDGDASTSYIVLDNGLEINAEILHFDKKKDIAVLYAPSGDLTPINLLTAPIDQFEVLWNVGYPGTAGVSLLSTQGLALSANRNNMLVSSALALNGMSGGPQLRCKDGEVEVVAAIVSFLHVPETTTETIDSDGVKTILSTRINSGTSITSPYIFETLIIGVRAKVAELEANTK